jgi:hypothetical protein
MKREKTVNEPIFFTEYQSFPRYRESTKKFVNITRIIDAEINLNADINKYGLPVVVVDLDDTYYHLTGNESEGFTVILCKFEHSPYLHNESKCLSCTANKNS